MRPPWASTAQAGRQIQGIDTEDPILDGVACRQNGRLQSALADGVEDLDPVPPPAA